MTEPHLTIPVSPNREALVDSEDYAAVSMYEWHVARTPKGKEYVATIQRYRSEKGRRRVMLHRLIMNVHLQLGRKKEFLVDHINGDTFDNRRANLRLATNGQNMQNAGVRKSNKSGLKGVCYCSSRRGSKYRAYIQAEGRQFYLGTFATAHEAALAYDRKAKELHGDFARPNFK
jgi:hypothetical protein